MLLPRPARSAFDHSASAFIPERYLSSDNIPHARRASNEMLHQSSTSKYLQPYDQTSAYPPRRWSDDYSYGRAQLLPSTDTTISSKNMKYESAFYDPLRHSYDNFGHKISQFDSYGQKYGSGQAYDTYGPHPNNVNRDYYNNAYRSSGAYIEPYYAEKQAPSRKAEHPNLRRYLLAKDPKDKRISGNGLGMKVVGGKEIPGTNGRLGAYIAKITPGGVVATLGELREGNLVVEWNGRNLLDKTYEEVQKIISKNLEEMEVEIAVRDDVDMINDKILTDSFYLDERSIHLNDNMVQNNPDYYDQSLSRKDQIYRADPYSSSKHPPFNSLDVNGNDPEAWKNYSSSKTGDYYKSRDLRATDGVYPEEGKENYALREDEYYYSSHRSRSPSRKDNRNREEDPYGDKNDRRRRRRRSSPRERQFSPDTRHDYRESSSYTPERRSSRSRERSPGRGRYEQERVSDSQLEPTTSTPYGQLHSMPSSPNLTSADSPKSRTLPRSSNNHRSSSSHYQQGYAYEDGYTNQTSSSRHDPRSGQRQSKEHKKHSSRSNGKSSRSSRGKLIHQGSGSKQDHSSLGQVELQICYDSTASILYVTVIRAKGLYTLREDGETCPDPFVKVYLLPGRSIENQRRTRHFTRTSNPDWNQTMVYPSLQSTDLKKRYLEVTAWNYGKNKPNEFLGEVVLDLSDPLVLDEEPKWYQLQEMVEQGQQQA